MAIAGRAWRALVRDPEPGTHAIFWYDGPRNLLDPVETFLEGAISRGDLVVLSLPPAQQEVLRAGSLPGGALLDRLSDEGSLVRTDPASFVPHDLAGIGNLGATIETFSAQARAAGAQGLSLVGRMSTSVFERGDAVLAEAMERAAAVRLGTARMLCLYDRGSATLDRYADALAVTRAHTHAVTALSDDRFYVEAVGRPRG